MRRKCDRCDREATVHEVNIKDGAKVEKHLCESCAREDGIVIQAQVPINELITKFVISQTAGGAAEGSTPAPARAQACPECGMTFADFRQQGLLGCPECYTAFESQLAPLIERAHEGATHHCGKSPVRGAGCLDRQHQIASLRKQLSDAIAAEQYERAATLRDQILHVEKPEAPQAPTPPARKAAPRGGAPGGRA